MPERARLNDYDEEIFGYFVEVAEGLKKAMKNEMGWEDVGSDGSSSEMALAGPSFLEKQIAANLR